MKGSTLWLVVFLLPVSAVAAEAPADLAPVTLPQTLEMLRQRSPRVAAEAAQIDVARASIITAETLPNPSLAYGATQLATGANTGAATQHQVVPSSRCSFGDSGACDSRWHATRRSRYRPRWRGATPNECMTCIGLLPPCWRCRGACAFTMKAWRIPRIKGIVEGRALAGDKSRYDVLRIEAEYEAAQAQQGTVNAEWADACGALAQVLGVPTWTHQAQGDLHTERPPETVAGLWDAALTNHPLLRLVTRHEATALATVEREERERWPVPALALGLVATRRENSLSAYAGLSLPIPLFDRSQGPIARAEAEARQAGLERQAVMTEVRASSSAPWPCGRLGVMSSTGSMMP